MIFLKILDYLIKFSDIINAISNLAEILKPINLF